MAVIGRIISGERNGIRPIGPIGLICLIVLLGLSGCGSSFNWTGHWSGKRDLPLPPNGNPNVLATISKVELTIEAGGHFELLEGGIPKSGTMRTEGKKAFLQVTHFMGKPIGNQGEVAVQMNQEIAISAQKDGSLLYDDPGGLIKETVRLERQKTESQPGG